MKVDYSETEENRQISTEIVAPAKLLRNASRLPKPISLRQNSQFFPTQSNLSPMRKNLSKVENIFVVPQHIELPDCSQVEEEPISNQLEDAKSKQVRRFVALVKTKCNYVELKQLLNPLISHNLKFIILADVRKKKFKELTRRELQIKKIQTVFHEFKFQTIQRTDHYSFSASQEVAHDLGRYYRQRIVAPIREVLFHLNHNPCDRQTILNYYAVLKDPDTIALVNKNKKVPQGKALV